MNAISFILPRKGDSDQSTICFNCYSNSVFSVHRSHHHGHSAH